MLLLSVHPHPLEPCNARRYCCVRGPRCKFVPCAYTSTEENWDICQVCFDKAPRDEAGPTVAKDSLADLLHDISNATHDEEEGDAAEDDMGDAMIAEEDEDVDIQQMFREAQKEIGQQHHDDDEEDW